MIISPSIIIVSLSKRILHKKEETMQKKFKIIFGSDTYNSKTT